MAHVPFIILIFYPLLTLAVIWQRALLIAQHKTALVPLASLFEMITLTVTLYLLIDVFDYAVVISSACALLIGRIFAYFVQACDQPSKNLSTDFD